MNQENERKLVEDFPNLYRGVNLPITENLMAFGFECGDGWFDLLYDLSKKLTETSPEIYAVQVKEKFGTLRFYITDYPDEANIAVQKAEKLSGVTCEECGKPGVLCHSGRWLKTICGECMSMINEKYSNHYKVCKEKESEND
jgi:ssDNA-binding Zn-finger/Zn-ribbon topoisomerase 1